MDSQTNRVTGGSLTHPRSTKTEVAAKQNDRECPRIADILHGDFLPARSSRYARAMRLRCLLLTALLLCLACGDDDSPVPDADTGTSDTGGSDSGNADTMTTDTGTEDAADTGSTDTGTTDTGTDASTTDAGSTDTGTSDTGTMDSGTADAGADASDGFANVGESCRERACRPGLLCEGGPSCDDRWVCIASTRPCSDDESPSCSCNGETFYGSSTCPEQSVAYSGACRDEEISCDQRDIRCRVPAPTCPDGQVPSVEGSCWGPCVAIDECACEGPDDCPDRDRYTCHRFRSRCGPYL